MARAVIGGLMTSTILTLFVVPVVYTLLDDMVKMRVRGLLGRKMRTTSAGGEPDALPASGD